jgi:hypothetical protein
MSGYLSVRRMLNTRGKGKRGSREEGTSGDRRQWEKFIYMLKSNFSICLGPLPYKKATIGSSDR